MGRTGERRHEASSSHNVHQRANGRKAASGGQRCSSWGAAGGLVQRHSVTQACRALWLAALAFSATPSASALLQRVWDSMRRSPLVRHDSFEPLLVVATFSACFILYALLDLVLPKALMRPWRLTLKDGAAASSEEEREEKEDEESKAMHPGAKPLAAAGAMQSKGHGGQGRVLPEAPDGSVGPGSGSAIATGASKRDPRDNMDAWRWEGGRSFYNETFWYIAPLVLFDVLYPRRQLPEAAPSALALVVEVVVSLMLYDALFFIGHVACHKVPWLYRLAHAKHHTFPATRAIDTVKLTFLEEALDVACSIAALKISGAHPLSRAVYNVTIVCLLVELHSGYEFPWMLQDVVPLGLWAGSRRHAAHHRTGKVYF